VFSRKWSKNQPCYVNIPRTSFVGYAVAVRWEPILLTIKFHPTAVLPDELTFLIDKGIPTAGLLAHVLIGKYLDHVLLYRQEGVFQRSGLALPRSTRAQWVGA
jgi:Transposase IS66 family